MPLCQPRKKMPLWRQWERPLTDELSDFAPTSILDGISAYQHEFGRARLIERLSEILFVKEAQPGIAHQEFCTIPFDIVCTTNFDFLLERQYDLTRVTSIPWSMKSSYRSIPVMPELCCLNCMAISVIRAG